MKDFITFKENAELHRQERRNRNYKNISKYGIGLLDNYLWWIYEKELVVIGAPTWCWKTTIANTIAITNALAGRKVGLLSLEWDQTDINEMWNLKYINNKIKDSWSFIKSTEYKLNLTDVIALEDEAISNTPKSLQDNLFIFKKEYIPKAKELENLVVSLKQEQVQLLIVDHLHYLDFWSKLEVEAITEIMKTLKLLTELKPYLPVVLISHLSRNVSGRPKISDLHWSSNIEKNANTVILLNPCDSSELVNNLPDWKYYRGTEIIVAKNRTGVPVPAVFETHFNLKTKEYMNWEDFNLLSPDEVNRATLDDDLSKKINQIMKNVELPLNDELPVETKEIEIDNELDDDWDPILTLK